MLLFDAARGGADRRAFVRNWSLFCEKTTNRTGLRLHRALHRVGGPARRWFTPVNSRKSGFTTCHVPEAPRGLTNNLGKRGCGVYHGGVGTRETRMSRGYTPDTRPVPCASKRVFGRGSRHRRTFSSKSLFRTSISQNETYVRTPPPYDFQTPVEFAITVNLYGKPSIDSTKFQIPNPPHLICEVYLRSQKKLLVLHSNAARFIFPFFYYSCVSSRILKIARAEC